MELLPVSGDDHGLWPVVALTGVGGRGYALINCPKHFGVTYSADLQGLLGAAEEVFLRSSS